MIILNVVRGRKIYKHRFNSITEAYHYYIEHYATEGDKQYYQQCANHSLDSITSEETMEAIFWNVFEDAFITED